MQQNIDQADHLRSVQNLGTDGDPKCWTGSGEKVSPGSGARIKSEFLDNMSHELCTSLNGIIGFTRQMLKTNLSMTQANYIQIIDRSANNLLTIINDVLDCSKLEAGQLVLEHIPFSLRETLDGRDSAAGYQCS